MLSFMVPFIIDLKDCLDVIFAFIHAPDINLIEMTRAGVNN